MNCTASDFICVLSSSNEWGVVTDPTLCIKTVALAVNTTECDASPSASAVELGENTLFSLGQLMMLISFGIVILSILTGWTIGTYLYRK